MAAGSAGGDRRREEARAGAEGVRAAGQHEPGRLPEPDHAGGPAVLRGTVGRRVRHRRQPARRRVERGGRRTLRDALQPAGLCQSAVQELLRERAAG